MKLRFDDIQNFLNEPTFEVAKPLQNFIVSILVGSFISLFLLVFYSNELYKTYTWFHFGLITTFAINFVYYFYPAILPNLFKIQDMKMKHEIFHNFFLVFNIAVFNMIYGYFYLDMTSLNYQFGIFLITFAIGAFPTVFIFMSFKIIHLKRHLDKSEKINIALQNKENRPVSGTETIKIDNLNIAPDDFLFVKSEGNYLKFNYLSGDELESDLIRYTLKDFLGNTQTNNHIRRCHRSYAVNAEKIKNVSGNSRGYQIYLNNYDDTIPMSNSYSEDILNAINIQ